MLTRFTYILAFIVLLASHASAENRSILSNAIAAVDANVVFMRHALAPGYGDPANFSLSDCDTQRNLDLEGRKQASYIGLFGPKLLLPGPCQQAQHTREVKP